MSEINEKQVTFSAPTEQDEGAKKKLCKTGQMTE